MSTVVEAPQKKKVTKGKPKWLRVKLPTGEKYRNLRINII